MWYIPGRCWRTVGNFSLIFVSVCTLMCVCAFACVWQLEELTRLAEEENEKSDSLLTVVQQQQKKQMDMLDRSRRISVRFGRG